MKQHSKELINKWGIGIAMGNRRNKTAAGMTFTNERRARRTNNSFCIRSMMNESRYRSTDDAARLSVYGTTDSLAKFMNYKISLVTKKHPTDYGYTKQVYVLRKNRNAV